MTFNSSHLSTNEPAFMSNEKFSRSRPRGLHKSLGDCCYSLGNLILLVACLIGLVFAAKFFYDESLYDYGEHLLSLRFYRQLIYLLVVLVLVLLVPLFNALGACFLSTERKARGSLAGTRLIYVILMGLLVFIALAFVAPFIRASSVATQLSHELRRHMKFRYDNDFSYQLIDQIQEEFTCCDEEWYRSNFRDRLPTTCYEPDGTFSLIYERSCADVIGQVVATRCAVLAACLVAILIGLGILLATDLIEMLARSVSGESGARHYDVGAREAKRASSKRAGGSPASLAEAEDEEEEDDVGDDSLRQVRPAASKRLGLEEAIDRERDAPLLQPGLGAHHRAATPSPAAYEDHPTQTTPDPYNSGPVYSPTTAPILTRANYLGPRARPQSPMFVGADTSGANRVGLAPVVASPQPKAAPKSALKKSPAGSMQRIDSASSSGDDDDCDNRRTGTTGSGRLEQQARDSPTRRSLLSVRFAQ